MNAHTKKSFNKYFWNTIADITLILLLAGAIVLIVWLNQQQLLLNNFPMTDFILVVMSTVAIALVLARVIILFFIKLTQRFRKEFKLIVDKQEQNWIEYFQKGGLYGSFSEEQKGLYNLRRQNIDWLPIQYGITVLTYLFSALLAIMIVLTIGVPANIPITAAGAILDVLLIMVKQWLTKRPAPDYLQRMIKNDMKHLENLQKQGKI